MIQVFGAPGNAEMEPMRTSLARAGTAEPSYPPASAAGLFFATMLAGNPRNDKTGSYNSQRLENYRGQNRRFMRVFHQKKGGMVSHGPGALEGPRGEMAQG